MEEYRNYAAQLAVEEAREAFYVQADGRLLGVFREHQDALYAMMAYAEQMNKRRPAEKKVRGVLDWRPED